MQVNRDELARKVLQGESAKQWQNRPLEPVYAIVFMDALFRKLRVDGRVKNVAAYLMVGIDPEGRKKCLGLWLGQSERASPPTTCVERASLCRISLPFAGKRVIDEKGSLSRVG